MSSRRLSSASSAIATNSFDRWLISSTLEPQPL